jgi:DNA-binding response OmpR family regulator
VTTVLVVDDEPIVREVVVKYLEREGFRTLEAADGDRARELLERDSPGLVVLDVMLPGTDGLELCRWIRSRSDLPVIMLTARAKKPTGSSASSWEPTTLSPSRSLPASSRRG